VTNGKRRGDSPSAARVKTLVELATSEPSRRTPLTRNSMASRTLSSESWTCSLSLVTLKPEPP